MPRIEVTRTQGHFRVGSGILRRGRSDWHKGKVLHVWGDNYERVERVLVQLILHYEPFQMQIIHYNRINPLWDIK